MHNDIMIIKLRKIELFVMDSDNFSVIKLRNCLQAGADPGGGPGGPGPPLTLGFEAPKLSIFGPYLIFP